MDLELTERSALVTGSSAGIGEAIALELAREGARVLVHGRRRGEAARVAGLIQSAGGDASWCSADLTDDDGARRLLETARDYLGTVEILVNNAGAYEFSSTWGSLTTDDWLRRFDGNVGSAVRVTSGLLADMVANKWGRIVNIGSTDATEPEAALPEYAASKAALANLSLSLSRACHGTGVTANTVTPGFILTGTVLDYLRRVGEARSWPVDDDELLADTALRELFGSPRGGWGRPADVAYVVAMLSSPRADWITGADFRVDGGGVTPVPPS